MAEGKDASVRTERNLEKNGDDPSLVREIVDAALRAEESEYLDVFIHNHVLISSELTQRQKILLLREVRDTLFAEYKSKKELADQGDEEAQKVVYRIEQARSVIRRAVDSCHRAVSFANTSRYIRDDLLLSEEILKEALSHTDPKEFERFLQGKTLSPEAIEGAHILSALQTARQELMKVERDLSTSGQDGARLKLLQLADIALVRTIINVRVAQEEESVVPKKEKDTETLSESKSETALEKMGREFTDSLMSAYPSLCATTEYRFLPRSHLRARDIPLTADFSAETFSKIAAESGKVLTELKKRKTESDGDGVQHNILKNFASMVSLEFGKRRVHECNPSFYISAAKWSLIFLLERLEENGTHISVVRDTLATASSALQALRRNITHIEPNTGEFHLESLREFGGFLSEHVEPRIKRMFGSSLLARLDLVAVESAYEDAIEHVENQEELIGYDRRQVFWDILHDGMGIEDSPGVLQMLHAKTYRTAVNAYERAVSVSGEDSEGNIQPEELDAEIQGVHSEILSRLATVNFPFSLDKVLELKHVPDYLASSWPRAAYHQNAMYVKADQPLDKSLLRLLLAHEGFPGHELHERILSDQSDPIRRNIENPVSYEGWAVFSEKLVTSLPDASVSQAGRAIESASMHRYLAMRAARGLIDLAVNYFETDPEEIIKNYPWMEDDDYLRSVVAEVSVNPGEYVPYLAGFSAINRLYEQYVPIIGPKEFFKQILDDGQASWPVIDNNLKDFVERKKGNDV